MKIIERLFTLAIFRATGMVLFGFLGLFIFLDFIREIEDVSPTGYRLQYAIAFVLLNSVRQLYDILPVAVLIGTVYCCANWAKTSEFVILRACGFSPLQAIKLLLRIGLILVAVLLVIGEWIAPIASESAVQIKQSFRNANYSRDLLSGAWIRDINTGDSSSLVINVARLLPGDIFKGWTLFRYSADKRLVDDIRAESGTFSKSGQWTLHNVSLRHYPQTGNDSIRMQKLDQLTLNSSVSPALLNTVFRDPDYMNLVDLVRYVVFLAQNKQDSNRYQAAIWRKLNYPSSLLVMLLLALPFAYTPNRREGVSGQVFIGVMIGISFVLVSQMSLNFGLLQSWSPFFISVTPTLAYLALALVAIYWVGYR